MSNVPSAPGWRDDPDGRRRWWDGKHWGAYAPWDPSSAPRVVRSSSSSVRLDRRYLLDPTEPGYHAPRRFEPAATKSMGLAYALLVLLGPVGAHRSYLGRPGSASVMLMLTGFGAALLLAPLNTIPVLEQIDRTIPLQQTGLGLLAAVALWWFTDLFRTAGLVRKTNRLALLPPGPRTYYRGWPPA